MSLYWVWSSSGSFFDQIFFVFFFLFVCFSETQDIPLPLCATVLSEVIFIFLFSSWRLVKVASLLVFFFCCCFFVFFFFFLFFGFPYFTQVCFDLVNTE